jgi:hypothetical protein
MRYRILLVSIAIFCSMFMLFGCSKKDEPPQKQANANQEDRTPAGAAENAQLAKAVALYQDFWEAFGRMGNEHNIDVIQRRVELTAKTRDDEFVLMSESQDPEAQQFLTKFADLLQQYTDAGQKVISMEADIRKGEEEIKQIQENSALDSSNKYGIIGTLRQTQSALVDGQHFNLNALDKVTSELKDLK